MRTFIDDLPIGRKMAAAFTLMFLCTVAIAAVAYIKMDSIRSRVTATEHALHKIDLVETLAIQLVDQQTGVRGFLISGDPAFLAPYEKGVQGLAETSEKLRAIDDGDTDFRRSAEGLVALAGRYSTEVADRQIRLMRHPDTVEEARMLEAAGVGKRLVDELRATTDRMISHEMRRLETLMAEEYSAIRTGFRVIEIGLPITLLLSVVLAILATRGIATPINGMTALMKRLAGGDRGVTIDALGRGDEIGTMAEAVEVFRRNAIEADRLAAEQAEEHAAKARRAENLDGLLRRFQAEVTRALSTVESSARELNGTASTMASVAEQTRSQALASATAAEQTTANVQTVATATEEMSATLQEIASQVAKSNAITARAVREAEETDREVRGLNEAAVRIGEVVGLINQIASQTNLLALNATIEAARAGEAGKGFAVVASEVKGLAGQTAKATDDIAAQVNAMQQATSGVVGAIQRIGETILSINDISTAIAAAVEEQTAATREISRNVHGAAQGTEQVSANVAQVNAAAGRTGDAARLVLGAAGQLSRESDALRGEVDRFMAGIRAA